MLSINTNLSSLIAQRSLNNSTRLLNQAIERMTTGYKINHAKDNAANYAIATNMTTKLGAYQVAEDNCAMGLDLINTANDNLNLISDKLARLRALAEQAANGTYGEKSLKAINSEARALVDETNRIFNTTEYNGQKIFGHSGQFLEEVQQRDTSAMDKLESVDVNTKITSGTYSISSAEELAKLATMANAGNIQGGEFVLANDIDLSAYSTGQGWVPIGAQNWSDKHFNGTFDGNGYVVRNLYTNRPNTDRQGLFGAAQGVIKNLGIENVDITGQNGCGALVGIAKDNAPSIEIDNCYAINVKASGATLNGSGGLIGELRTQISCIKNCYAEEVSIHSNDVGIGGLIGRTKVQAVSSTIENCYATGDISGNGALGGLVGGFEAKGKGLISNCFSNCNVNGTASEIGGLCGWTVGGGNHEITNCYATGDVTATGSGCFNISGLIGATENTTISHCYSTSNIKAYRRAGGLVGFAQGATTIKNCYYSGVLDSSYSNGGIVSYNGSNAELLIKDCYVLGESKSLNGIFVYNNWDSTGNMKIENCYYNPYYTGKQATTATKNATVENVNTYDGKEPFWLDRIEFAFQVGIQNNANSQIELITSFALKEINNLSKLGIDNNDYLSIIDTLTNKVSAKQTELGAAQNRVESALEEISTHYENLSSSRSTLIDADIAKVSSDYIKQQILQQASATLMATANQSPSIALQLI